MGCQRAGRMWQWHTQRVAGDLASPMGKSVSFRVWGGVQRSRRESDEEAEQGEDGDDKEEEDEEEEKEA